MRGGGWGDYARSSSRESCWPRRERSGRKSSCRGKASRRRGEFGVVDSPGDGGRRTSPPSRSRWSRAAGRLGEGLRPGAAEGQGRGHGRDGLPGRLGLEALHRHWPSCSSSRRGSSTSTRRSPAYLPDFAPGNPFDKPITLRQLMSHRSGLVREPPVGHYFDPTAPSLADTVRSLNETELVVRPGDAGRSIPTPPSRSSASWSRGSRGEPFAAAGERRRPRAARAGADERSSRRPRSRRTLARGVMWTYDGRTFDAPTFPLGHRAGRATSYSTVARPRPVPERPVRRRQRARRADPEARDARGDVDAAVRRRRAKTPDFGLGFVPRRARRPSAGRPRRARSTASPPSVAALPDEKLGVAVVVVQGLRQRHDQADRRRRPAAHARPRRQGSPRRRSRRPRPSRAGARPSPGRAIRRAGQGRRPDRARGQARS